MTHEKAVAKLLKMDFKWARRFGDISTEPAADHLTCDLSTCCHGWVEISGSPGLLGEILMTVDGGFPLRFPSLADMVDHLADAGPMTAG
jgi:hypothetical protein